MTPLTSLPPRVREIIVSSANRAGVTVEAMRSGQRGHAPTRAREDAAWRLRAMMWRGERPSLTMIAAWLGTTHSAVFKMVVRSGVDDIQARLLWQYGADRTAAILTGQDAATIIDIAKWRTLGIVPRA